MTQSNNKKSRKKKKAEDAPPQGELLNSKLALELAESVANVALLRYSNVLSFQERESAAWLGAARAVNSYDPSKGASLRTWTQIKAKYAVEDEERRERRQRRRFGKSIGLNFAIPQWEAEPEDDATIERRKRTCELVKNALQSLDTRTREIVERVWYCGESQAEIARSFGFSQSWCSRLYRRGMSTMKEKLSAIMGMPKE